MMIGVEQIASWSTTILIPQKTLRKMPALEAIEMSSAICLLIHSIALISFCTSKNHQWVLNSNGLYAYLFL